jgi:hypothetical protein
MHNGQEMLFLSTSSVLHAVKVPHDMIEKYCAPASNNEKNTHSRPNVLPNIGDSSLIKLEPPKFGLSGLKRYGFSDLDKPRGSVLRAPNTISVLQHQQMDMNDLSAQPAILSAAIDFWTDLQNSVLKLEEKLENGYMEGLTIALVDKFARQVIISKHLFTIVTCSCCTDYFEFRASRFYSIFSNNNG